MRKVEGRAGYPIVWQTSCKMSWQIIKNAILSQLNNFLMTNFAVKYSAIKFDICSRRTIPEL